MSVGAVVLAGERAREIAGETGGARPISDLEGYISRKTVAMHLVRSNAP